eukprot:TRINITY_DN13829_c0_g1_i3.p1 TRINITY_DN13829_c0_g1~~TRINITY_DN13829_c0_g1_i3.p1  ORF type:complete len:211 (-),score=42.09 TRINITY_DN13829_c0_g1_i3:302-934(-)
MALPSLLGFLYGRRRKQASSATAVEMSRPVRWCRGCLPFLLTLLCRLPVTCADTPAPTYDFGPLFEVRLEDKMALPPGVTADDLFYDTGFIRHAKHLLASGIVLVEGYTRGAGIETVGTDDTGFSFSEITITNVTILEDVNAKAENGYGGSYYGQKWLEVKATIIAGSKAMEEALASKNGKDLRIHLASTAPWRYITIGRPATPENPFFG